MAKSILFKKEDKDYEAFTEEIVQALWRDRQTNGEYRVKMTFTDGRKPLNCRLFCSYIQTNWPSIGVLTNGKRRYGIVLSNWFGILKDIRVYIPDPEPVQWQKSWQKVAERLEASGLWDNLLEEIRIALAVGYEGIQRYYTFRANWNNDIADVIEWAKIHQPTLVKQVDGEEKLALTGWMLRYPAKIKKMYFGKYDNKGQLEQIARILRVAEDGHVSSRAGYDVSFEYQPRLNKAWYSEEYRGMGNGHYYLALDATHAVFCEDD